MKLSIDFDPTLSQATRRALRWIALPIAVFLGAASVAHATLTPDPQSWIGAGKTVSAASLSGNLTQLDQRLAALESAQAKATQDGGYSLGATYCGQTASVSGSGFGQYTGAKALCQAITACGAAAHMCTGDELTRSVSVGKNPPSSGSGAWYSGGTSTVGGASSVENDCAGWLENAANFQGSAWVNNQPNMQNGPSVAACATSIPIDCCQ